MKTTIKVLVLLVLLSCNSETPKQQNEFIQLKEETPEMVHQRDLRLYCKLNCELFEKDLQSKDSMKCKQYYDSLIKLYPDSKFITDCNEFINRISTVRKTKQEEKNKIINATKNLRKEFDDISGITWYYDYSSPKFINYNGLFIYIGKKGNDKPWLRLKIQYAADDWLFIESYIVKIDDFFTFDIVEKEYGEIKRDNGEGIWEWIDRQVEVKEFNMIKSLSKCKTAKIRFNGKDYHKDRLITINEINGIKRVLEAYYALGGTEI